jgi:hypothetical protein
MQYRLGRRPPHGNGHVSFRVGRNVNSSASVQGHPMRCDSQL